MPTGQTSTDGTPASSNQGTHVRSTDLKILGCGIVCNLLANSKNPGFPDEKTCAKKGWQGKFTSINIEGVNFADSVKHRDWEGMEANRTCRSKGHTQLSTKKREKLPRNLS